MTDKRRHRMARRQRAVFLHDRPCNGSIFSKTSTTLLGPHNKFVFQTPPVHEQSSVNGRAGFPDGYGCLGLGGSAHGGDNFEPRCRSTTRGGSRALNVGDHDLSACRTRHADSGAHSIAHVQRERKRPLEYICMMHVRPRPPAPASPQFCIYT